MFGEVELFIPPWCGCSVLGRKRKTKYCLPIIRQMRVRYLVTFNVYITFVYFNRGFSSPTLHQEFHWPQCTMVACPWQCSMATPLLHTTFVAGDLNVPPKIWLKSVVHGPNPSKDTLQKCIASPLYTSTPSSRQRWQVTDKEGLPLFGRKVMILLRWRRLAWSTPTS